jgi:hypothetical protein
MKYYLMMNFKALDVMTPSIQGTFLLRLVPIGPVVSEKKLEI